MSTPPANSLHSSAFSTDSDSSRVCVCVCVCVGGGECRGVFEEHGATAFMADSGNGNRMLLQFVCAHLQDCTASQTKGLHSSLFCEGAGHCELTDRYGQFILEILDLLRYYTTLIGTYRRFGTTYRSYFFILIFVVPCIMLNSEIIPTRCNNCVYSSQSHCEE